MKKSLFALAPLALLLLVANNASAASNAQITITGSVVATSCDINLSTTSLDLGNVAQADFASTRQPIASSQRDFALTLSNCGTPEASQVAQVQVTGSTLSGENNIFNSDTTRNTGVMLTDATNSSGFIDNNAVLTIATADASAPQASDFNGQRLSLRAGLASTATDANVDLGGVTAPILFNFITN
ncbi:fimbrial protein [Candidatus Symbiopectobacterium sp. NZEC135]|uniref:fimbrial protein n=1 Tax=Candidatus Symbiopectobacterium sp. NZEC135 TaxID=2820471 RepID=UPI0022273BD5|nr:fimbrial protein [Candidatus Symbiopectobacterium sp. NZEC135]MCW2481819.1 hypothetical protein [Candidatus Symbiopectobacterium sp. NZEC135]